MSLPSKVGSHSFEVVGIIERGEVDGVRRYCEGDVINLFGLYMRWVHLAGKAGLTGHDASVPNLVERLEAERAAGPHLGDFFDRWRAMARPRSMFVGTQPDRVATRRRLARPR